MELQMRDLISWISCPVCLEVPTSSSSIFQCQIGHTICEGCRKNVTKCPNPNCAAPLTEIRNLLAQELAKIIQVHCKYVQFGCPGRNMTGSEREEHHKQCDYRPVTCQLPLGAGAKCDGCVRIDNYLQHIFQVHGAISIKESSICEYSEVQRINRASNLSIQDFPPILHMKNAGKDFLLVTNTRNNVTPFWALYIVDSQIKPINDPTAAWGEISIQNPRTKVELRFRGPANSIRLSAEEITKSGMCLMVNPNAFTAVSARTQNSWEWIAKISFRNQNENVNEIYPPLSSGLLKQCPPPPGLHVSISPNVVGQGPLNNVWKSASGPSVPNSLPVSGPSSSTSSVSDMEKTSRPIAETSWPFCSGVNKELHMAFRTNFSARNGAGVCIIRGIGKPAMYYTAVNSLANCSASRTVNLEAHNATKIMSIFKAFITPNTKIWISCPCDISPSSAEHKSTFLQIFHEQISNIAKTRSGLQIKFRNFEPNRIENIAVSSLLVSKQLCDKELKRGNIVEMSGDIPTKREQKLVSMAGNTVSATATVERAKPMESNKTNQPSPSELTTQTQEPGPPPAERKVATAFRRLSHTAGEVPVSVPQFELPESNASASLREDTKLEKNVWSTDPFSQQTRVPESQPNVVVKKEEKLETAPTPAAAIIRPTPTPTPEPEPQRSTPAPAQVQEVKKLEPKDPRTIVPFPIRTPPVVSKATSSGPSEPKPVAVTTKSEPKSEDQVDAAPVPVSSPSPPPASEPSKVIKIAVETDFDWKYAFGICIINEIGKSSKYSACTPHLDSSDAKTKLEFDAENATECIKIFKKHFAPNSAIFIACSSDLSQRGAGATDSYLEMLHKQVDQLTKGSNVKITFSAPELDSVEDKAIRHLKFSDAVCKKELEKLGILKVS